MNWSALPTKSSGAVESKDRQRAALLERVEPCSSCGYSGEQDWLADYRLLLQALIAGSGLLSRNADNAAQNTQEAKQRGNTTPTEIPCTCVLSADCRQSSSTPQALPHCAEKVPSQHTLRQHSPSKYLEQSEDSTAATGSATSLTQPYGPTQWLMRKERMLPSVSAHTPKESWSKGQIQSTDLEGNTLGTPDETMPQSSAWQALVALSDSYDRSAGSR